MILNMERMLKYFILAGLVQYAFCITQYLLQIHVQNHVLSAEAKSDMSSRSFVYHHHGGYGHVTPDDQFGKQMAIKITKRVLKLYTRSMSARRSMHFQLRRMRPTSLTTFSLRKSEAVLCWNSTNKSWKNRCNLDVENRDRIASEVEKSPHPLKGQRIICTIPSYHRNFTTSECLWFFQNCVETC